MPAPMTKSESIVGASIQDARADMGTLLHRLAGILDRGERTASAVTTGIAVCALAEVVGDVGVGGDTLFE